MIKLLFFQVLLSAFIGPSLVYYTLVYWVYPMKDYVGETGCHITFFFRNAGVFAFQLQSLSMAFFRYICLFHSGSVRKLHISLNVSCKGQIMKPLCLCLQVLIRFQCMFNWSFTYWIIVKIRNFYSNTEATVFSLKIYFKPDRINKKRYFHSACNNNYFCLSLR